MFKRAVILFGALAALASICLAPAVSAQKMDVFEVRAVRQHGSGIDRIFEFDVADLADRELVAQGRVVLLNVYDASLPVTIPVTDAHFKPGGVTVVSVRWQDAPLAGRVRALLVLNDGQDPSLIRSFDFWIFPFAQASLFVGVVILLITLALLAMRLPKRLKGRVPSNMLAYAVEDDDTVVSLAARFDVTWEDIVRANRLKPPYVLKPGERILVPSHDLRRPSIEKT